LRIHKREQRIFESQNYVGEGTFPESKYPESAFVPEAGLLSGIVGAAPPLTESGHGRVRKTTPLLVSACGAIVSQVEDDDRFESRNFLEQLELVGPSSAVVWETGTRWWAGTAAPTLFSTCDATPLSWGSLAPRPSKFNRGFALFARVLAHGCSSHKALACFNFPLLLVLGLAAPQVHAGAT